MTKEVNKQIRGLIIKIVILIAGITLLRELPIMGASQTIPEAFLIGLITSYAIERVEENKHDI